MMEYIWLQRFENSWYSRKKKIIDLICKGLVSRVAGKQELDERSCVFWKLPFPLGMFYDQNNVATLVVENKGNFEVDI